MSTELSARDQASERWCKPPDDAEMKKFSADLPEGWRTSVSCDSGGRWHVNMVKDFMGSSIIACSIPFEDARPTARYGIVDLCNVLNQSCCELIRHSWTLTLAENETAKAEKALVRAKDKNRKLRRLLGSKPGNEAKKIAKILTRAVRALDAGAARTSR